MATRWPPGSSTPPAPEIRQLQALVRRLDALHGMRTQEVNRRAARVTVAAVRDSIDAVLASLRSKTKRILRPSVPPR